MSTHINRTVKYLIDITLRTGQNNLGQNNAFENALKSRNIGRVDGFKIVNLYSEVQTDPKDVNVNDEMSMVDPEKWSDWTNDPNCVAIVAGWGVIRKNEKSVKDRRRKVTEWLNRNHSGKVGTLGTSPAGDPYHPQYYLREKGKIPVFKFGKIPEK